MIIFQCEAMTCRLLIYYVLMSKQVKFCQQRGNNALNTNRSSFHIESEGEA